MLCGQAVGEGRGAIYKEKGAARVWDSRQVTAWSVGFALKATGLQLEHVEPASTFVVSLAQVGFVPGTMLRGLEVNLALPRVVISSATLKARVV